MNTTYPLSPKQGIEYWKIPAFLPKTILRKGGKGRTIKLLQLALCDFHSAGLIEHPPFLRIRKNLNLESSEDEIPFVRDFSREDGFGVFGDFTQRSLSQAIHHLGLTGINVTAEVWKALGLTVGTQLEHLFNIPTANQRGKLKLEVVGNHISATFHPTFYVSQLLSTSLGRTMQADPQTTAHYIALGVEGLFRWNNSHISIGGLDCSFSLTLVDRHGHHVTSVNDYQSGRFTMSNKIGTNVFLYKDKPHQSRALLAPYWKRNLNLVFSVGDTYRGGKNFMRTDKAKGENIFKTTTQHEFGHLLGLADAYSYENHFGKIPIVGKPFGRLISPDSTDITGKTGIMANGWVVTQLEYEMILFAWLRNRWQSYKGGVLGSLSGEISQAFYYF